MQVELAWGRWRRWYLKTFRRRYVQRMQELRRGEPKGCPHEVLDPRDLKFYVNQTTCHWASEDDPFTWRDRLPFAREGLAELLLLSGFFLALALGLSFVYWPAALLPLVLAVFIVSFFRNPRRVAPTDPGLVVSPADGRVVLIEIRTTSSSRPRAHRHFYRCSTSSTVAGRRPGDWLDVSTGQVSTALLPASPAKRAIGPRLEENQPPFRHDRPPDRRAPLPGGSSVSKPEMNWPGASDSA